MQIGKDFQLKFFEEKSRALFDKWSTFVIKFPNTIAHQIKDKRNREIYDQLTAEIATGRKKYLDTHNLLMLFLISDSRDVILCLMLHAVLQPVRRISIKKKKLQTKNEFWRPSIAASQDSFLIHIVSEADVLPTIEKRANMYSEMGLSCQPYIIAVGRSLLELKFFFVVLDNILYKFESFLKALDACFKIHMVLNLNYAVESELVWSFIQKFFFDISTGKLCTRVLRLIEDLK